MSDMRQFVATPTVEECEARIEELEAEVAVWKANAETNLARVEELEAENERLRKKLEIAGAHPFPKDFDALDLAVERNKALLAENERLRGALKWIRENVKVSADRALAAAQEDKA